MNYQLPSWQDIALPVVLLLTGFVLMGGDWAGVLSLDRIVNLWPCALLLTGLVELGSEFPRQRRL